MISIHNTILSIQYSISVQYTVQLKISTSLKIEVQYFDISERNCQTIILHKIKDVQSKYKFNMHEIVFWFFWQVSGRNVTHFLSFISKLQTTSKVKMGEKEYTCCCSRIKETMKQGVQSKYLWIFSLKCAVSWI